MDYDLILGDCLDKMNEISNESIDMILCDLPYGTTKCKWDVVIDLDCLWNHYTRIVKNNGTIALFGTEPFSSNLRLSNIKWYRYDLYWVKEKPTNFMQLKKRFGKVTENICIFYNKQCTYNPQMVKYEGKKVTNKTTKSFNSIVASDSPKLKIKEYEDNGYRYPSDILRFNREKLGSTLHPTQKPVALCEYLIRTYTNEGDTVLDNCMGSATTGVACMNLNRNFIGIEKDKKYFNIARERMGLV